MSSVHFNCLTSNSNITKKIILNYTMSVDETNIHPLQEPVLRTRFTVFAVKLVNLPSCFDLFAAFYEGTQTLPKLFAKVTVILAENHLGQGHLEPNHSAHLFHLPFFNQQGSQLIDMEWNCNLGK